MRPELLNEGGLAARAVDLLGEAVRLPTRALGAEDELLKTVGYRMELNALAYRTAAAEGHQGEAMAGRIQEILGDPERFAPNVHVAAVDGARYQTYTQELGDAGQAYQKMAAAAPALKLITPFVRTPINIFKFAGERTPLALECLAVSARTRSTWPRITAVRRVRS